MYSSPEQGYVARRYTVEIRNICFHICFELCFIHRSCNKTRNPITRTVFIQYHLHIPYMYYGMDMCRISPINVTIFYILHNHTTIWIFFVSKNIRRLYVHIYRLPKTLGTTLKKKKIYGTRVQRHYLYYIQYQTGWPTISCIFSVLFPYIFHIFHHHTIL